MLVYETKQMSALPFMIFIETSEKKRSVIHRSIASAL